MTAPLTPEQRTAILDKIDELLGIRLDPEDPAYSSPSPPWGDASPAHACMSGGGRGEMSANPKSSKNPADAGISGGAIANPQSEEVSPSSEHVSRGDEAHFSLVPAPPPCTEVGRAVPSAPPQAPPASSSPTTPDNGQPTTGPSAAPPHVNTRPNTPETSTAQPSPTTDNQQRTPNQNPTPQFPPPAPLRGEVSVSPTNPQSTIRNPQFPISPLATTSPGSDQPHDHVPVFDRFGAWVQWLPRDGEGSYPKFDNPLR